MRAVPWSRARALAGELATALPPEEVPIAGAAGRVLAEPRRALAPVPGFDNAAMDGYAVRGDGPWRLTGRVLAGCPDPGALADRTAVEIATGAPVPAGTGRVVPYELAALDDGVVTATAEGREYIRRSGEDAAPGEVLLPAGCQRCLCSPRQRAAAAALRRCTRSRPWCSGWPPAPARTRCAWRAGPGCGCC